MVSRRKILSRSRDELHSDIYFVQDEEDDIWHSKDKLYQDHIQEVMNKWDSIDDEIWAKIIVLERNRRVAKAYARAPVITINGSNDGFDGFRIGVGGFENPMRDPNTENTIRQIGNGIKLKMDDIGNILIKRLSKGGVRVKNTTEENAVSNDILKLPGSLLELDKPFKVFDMKKFQQNINREMKRAYPDRRRLESQCISAVSFGHADTDILDSPIWVLVINVVAIEMLKSKIPPLGPPSPRIRPHTLENGMHSRPFGSGSSDEDPYSVAGSGSSGSSGPGNHIINRGYLGGRSRSREKPPKLPPRDTVYGSSSIWAKPEQPQVVTSPKTKEKSQGDDPYYSGLRARIPNFVKSRKKKANQTVSNIKEPTSSMVLSSSSSGDLMSSTRRPMGYNRVTNNNNNNNHHAVTSSDSSNTSLPPIPSHPFWWHTRLYADPNSVDSSDSDYSHIYGRLPIPNRGAFRKFPTKPMFLSQWE
ncbi:uncharacterized protein [Lepeophtheirus salmonis]|uniref:uncharacterized protein n=1 Tax=Lepeophtheirus salmonis TaxID=72036 RepID=UPI001AE65F35|nr:uncharacterized protein LOC121114889 [Lepeophtheirus salmonis]